MRPTPKLLRPCLPTWLVLTPTLLPSGTLLNRKPGTAAWEMIRCVVVATPVGSVVVSVTVTGVVGQAAVEQHGILEAQLDAELVGVFERDLDDRAPRS